MPPIHVELNGRPRQDRDRNLFCVPREARIYHNWSDDIEKSFIFVGDNIVWIDWKCCH